MDFIERGETRANWLLDEAYAVLARAWVMRDAKGMTWGVRDWDAVVLAVSWSGSRPCFTLTIRGAYPGSGLQHYMMGALGAPADLTIVSEELVA